MSPGLSSNQNNQSQFGSSWLALLSDEFLLAASSLGSELDEGSRVLVTSGLVGCASALSAPMALTEIRTSVAVIMQDSLDIFVIESESPL
jgi:hypothetical protein